MALTLKTNHLVALSIMLVLATPFAVHGLFWLDHALSYTGICGPHAPDIRAHACTRDQYLAEFGAGFAGAGLFMLEILALLGMAGAVGNAWIVRSARRSRDQASPT